MQIPSVPDLLLPESQLQPETTSIPSPARYPSPSPPPPPEPDRKACKERSQRTPNGRVWAHCITALVAYHDDWSPSMVKVADEKHVYDPPFHERVFGVRLKSGVDLSDEPKPRKLRMWPILTVADGMQCNEELLEITNETARESGLGAEDIPRRKAESADREVIVPKLEQRISKDLLPEILIVEDPENRTHARADGENADYKLKYRRVYPKPADPPDADAPRSAQLKLPSSVPPIGKGSHADVYHAHLTLGEPFCLVQHKDQPASVPTVRVAAKITFSGADDRAMLENEGRIYDALPEHLSEDWSGYNAIGESVTRYTDGRIPATAMVPKFYGFFVPVEESSRGRPILLMEDCGRPINPATLTTAQRAVCFAFAHRLYRENFIQHSFYSRNILLQPGPLTLPPDKRSLKDPSFRLIDFGRARCLDDLLSSASTAVNGSEPASASHGGQVSCPPKTRTKIHDEWTETFRSELEMAKDAVFGKVRRYRVGFDRLYFDGRVESADRAWAREWVVEAHAYDRQPWIRDDHSLRH